MRRFLIAFVTAGALWGTDVRLRDGDYTTTYKIVAGTTGVAGSPITVKVRNYAGANQHALNNGDPVFVQGVAGCFDANGYRKVATANQLAGTFTLTDASGAPIVCTGTWLDTLESGRVGVYHSYTLPAHPRVVVPPDGALNARVNGETAPAPTVAQNAPAWQGFANRFGTGGYQPSFSSSCDGVTPASCPNAEARMTSPDIYFGYALPGFALFWYADQRATASGAFPAASDRLNSTLYWLNHIERVPMWQQPNGPLNWANPLLASHGKGSYADWTSLTVFGASTAYSMVRSRMTPAQRTAFANKILNGVEWNTSCTLDAPIDTGNTAVSISGTSLTASGGLSAFSPNDWALIVPATATYGSGNFQWAQIASVVDDQHAKLVSSAPASPLGKIYRVPQPSTAYDDWSAGRCGLAATGNMQGIYMPAYTRSLAVTTSSAAYNSSATTITLNPDGGAVTLTPPFYLVTKFGEVLLVTAKNGRALTVTRGYFGTSALGIGQNDPLIATKWASPSNTAFPFQVTGDWDWNLTLNKQTGLIAAGLALADDDPRAITLLEQAVNYYHDYTLFDLEQTATTRMSGGLTGGYQMGRWGNMTSQIASMLQAIGYSGALPSFLQRYAYYPLYWTWPGSSTLGPGDDWASVYPSDLWWVWPLQYYFHGTPEQQYVRYWYDTVNNWNTASQWAAPSANWGIFWRLVFAASADTSADYRAVLNPWLISTTVDNAANPRPYGVVLSKKSFAGGSYLVANASNWLYDHDTDSYGYPTNYIASYNGAALIGGANSGTSTFGPGSSGNVFEVGGSIAANVRGFPASTSSGEGVGLKTVVDQVVGNATHVSARLNYQPMWKAAQGVTRAYRTWDHLKNGAEYVVVYDDVATAAPNQKRTWLYYTKYGDSSTTFTGGGTRAMVFKKPAQSAMVSTQLLFPDGSSPVLSHVSASGSNNETIDWGPVASAQMIAVHRISGNTTDGGLFASLAPADGNSVAAQVADDAGAWVLVYAKDGLSRDSRSVTTTYTVAGQALFHGMTPGTYRILADGAPLVSGLTAGSDGTLYFPADGAHTFVALPELPAISGRVLVTGSTHIN